MNPSFLFLACPEYCFGYAHAGHFVFYLVTLRCADPRFKSGYLRQLKLVVFNHRVSDLGKTEEISQMGTLAAGDGKSSAQHPTEGWDYWPWVWAPTPNLTWRSPKARRLLGPSCCCVSGGNCPWGPYWAHKRPLGVGLPGYSV